MKVKEGSPRNLIYMWVKGQIFVKSDSKVPHCSTRSQGNSDNSGTVSFWSTQVQREQLLLCMTLEAENSVIQVISHPLCLGDMLGVWPTDWFNLVSLISKAEYHQHSNGHMPYCLIILPNGRMYKVKKISPSTEPCGTPWLKSGVRGRFFVYMNRLESVG